MRHVQVIAGYLFALMSIAIFLLAFVSSIFDGMIEEDGVWIYLVVLVPVSAFSSYCLAENIYNDKETSHGYRFLVLGAPALLLFQYFLFFGFSTSQLLGPVLLYVILAALVSLPLKH